jgi:hypothetical protein
METHVAVSVAVHAHPVAAVTATVPVLAANGTLTEGAAIVGAQGAPACVTVKVLVPTVTVPVREVVVGLAATV